MMRYPIELRDRIFVKGYGLLAFAKNIDKNISKYSSGILGVHWDKLRSSVIDVKSSNVVISEFVNEVVI